MKGKENIEWYRGKEIQNVWESGERGGWNILFQVALCDNHPQIAIPFPRLFGVGFANGCSVVRELEEWSTQPPLLRPNGREKRRKLQPVGATVRYQSNQNSAWLMIRAASSAASNNKLFPRNAVEYKKKYIRKEGTLFLRIHPSACLMLRSLIWQPFISFFPLSPFSFHSRLPRGKCYRIKRVYF